MQYRTETNQPDRLQQIHAARQIVLHERRPLALAGSSLSPWIERSWRRCLDLGHEAQQPVAFDAVSAANMQRVSEASRALVQAARPVLAQLAHTMAHTRYFALLTDAQGVVVDVDGPIDRSDRRATVIARIGVDLSERAVGTTAIGAALHEQQPVWLHRGEHFFADTGHYSCAGAPVFGPLGDCVGMLDLTGIDVPERPEFQHLVRQCAQRIENTLLRERPYALLMRLRWSSGPLGGDGVDSFVPGESDGLLSMDADGYVSGSNSIARQMLPTLGAAASPRPHCSELFALPWEHLFDAAAFGRGALELPLWSGLRLLALPQSAAAPVDAAMAWRSQPSSSLRDVETVLIRKAVDQAKGNVAEAARSLGISRATVYRKLGSGARKD